MRKKLTKIDKLYIENNAQECVEDISTTLNKKVEDVQEYKVESPKIEQEGIPSEDDIEKSLREKHFYSDLRRQFTNNEMKVFIQHWRSLLHQFQGDVLPSEELDIKELISLEILKSRTLIEERKTIELKDECESELNQMRKLDRDTLSTGDKQIMKGLQASIATHADYIKGLRSSYITLVDKGDKVKKGVADSRSKRSYDFDKAKIDFTGLLRLLEEKHYKDKLARESEVLKMAKDQAQKDMGEYFEFADDKVDRILLNSKTVEGN